MSIVSKWAEEHKAKDVPIFIMKQGTYRVHFDENTEPRLQDEEKGRFGYFRVLIDNDDYVLRQKETTYLYKRIISFLAREIYDFQMIVTQHEGNSLTIELISKGGGVIYE